MTLNIDTLPASVQKVCLHIKQAGGTAWLVGGAVRDLLLQRSVNDIDLEVFGLSFEELHASLSQLGHCECVGRHFGVVKLFIHGQCIDVALPRRERKTSAGHRGFEITPDPFLDPEQATLRRDFTINAMMLEPLTDTFLDLHHGQQDLQQGLLRHVSSAFAEDPLRPLRGMQLAARYRLHLHPDTAILCRQLRSEAHTLPEERIWHEWRKWALADWPGCGLQFLDDSGWLQLYPELFALKGCAQDSRWHPEGDVWQHTVQVVDQMSRLAAERKLDADTHIVMTLAALVHDVGKPETSIQDSNGYIRSPGHAQAATPLIHAFIKQIAAPTRLLSPLVNLIHDHLTHLQNNPTDRAIRRLTARLAPATMQQWEMLVEADASGRSPAPSGRPALPWLQQAEKLKLSQQRPSPLVNGRMLIQLGFLPGAAMGKIIHQAYEAQLDGAFHTASGAVNWCREYRHHNEDKDT